MGRTQIRTSITTSHLLHLDRRATHRKNPDLDINHNAPSAPSWPIEFVTEVFIGNTTPHAVSQRPPGYRNFAASIRIACTPSAWTQRASEDVEHVARPHGAVRPRGTPTARQEHRAGDLRGHSSRRERMPSGRPKPRPGVSPTATAFRARMRSAPRSAAERTALVQAMWDAEHTIHAEQNGVQVRRYSGAG